MDFIEGTSLTDVKALKEQDYNLKEICGLLSKCFCKQIFDFGFVHGDPHSGNIFVTKDEKNQTQLVLLDHGIYKKLTPKTQFFYAQLWKGILSQNESEIKQASSDLGAGDEFQLFTSMITSKPYQKLIADKEKNLQKRLKKYRTEDERQELIKLADEKHAQISQLLQKIDRDLLLIFKINEYLYSIDKQMGSPINTYENTMNYCFFAIEQNRIRQDRSVKERINLMLQKYRFRILTFFYKLLIVY